MIDHFDWNDLSGPEARELARRVLFTDGNVPEELDVTGRSAELSFYPGLRFYRVTVHRKDGFAPEFFLLANEESLYYLDGTSLPIHAINGEQEIRLTEDNAANYLRFYCFAVRGGEGPFLLFEEPAGTQSEDGEGDASSFARPIEEKGVDSEDRFRFETTVHYNTSLFASSFAVERDGTVTMLDDETVLEDAPKSVLPDTPLLYARPAVEAMSRALGARPASGAEILRTLVSILLEHALDRQAETRLLSYFNRRLEEGHPLDRFAQMVTTAAPVVVVEGSMPFVEDTVAQIVQTRMKGKQLVRWVRPQPDPSDDTRLRVSVPEKGKGVVLLPLHSYSGIVDAERVAHDVAARDVACLIGCERVADLPDGLRQVVDLTLHLPRVDADHFEVFFQQVLASPPPSDWREGGTHWVTHVHHSDFQHPRGLELSPEEALGYVRDRAKQRLRTVEPVQGLGLEDLHGLGEARQFAEDLIADIHDAVHGRLDWQHVDRGVLLAGRPGTGKTTLARAIAKDCGIRFINASAASWQAVGHLGDHIRAIRSDFAQARRFAPSILFIDEIDSIGNRETFEGKNAQYSTQVVNAVLEQLQGMDTAAPVIVIAATNHSDRVDPALKRAGRLDRVIEIPRPNTESLAAIFRHYLAEYVGEELDPGIDVRALGGLAFGLTGADVELFVRGAVRRARKAGRPLSHSDLVDEITRKPRDLDAVPRLTASEVRRVAVHEAGHALAAFLGVSKGRDLKFISIIPRADGMLGFVARMPDERMLLTRREYLEQIKVMLAGRAAEEVVFGEDGITGGARSDLEVATRAALLMTTQFGLGPDRKLMWTDRPTTSQRQEADRILTEVYDDVLASLRDHADRLDVLAGALVERQELTGEEARELLVEPQTA